MRILIFCLLLAGLVSAQSYRLELLVNNEVLSYTPEAPAQLAGSSIHTESQAAVVVFEGGRLELNLSDWDTFDHAHVLAVRFQRTAEGIYTVNATVRHNDQGWDNYADAFEVKGEAVKNGLRVLLHPHDTEQPFIRSQTGVLASGLVWVEAKDNVEISPGSKIFLDLAAFEDLETIEISYDLRRLE